MRNVRWTTCSPLLCLSLASALTFLPSQAPAAEYILGSNVQPCTDTPEYAEDCRPTPGSLYQRIKAKVQYKDGTVRIEEVVSTIQTECDASGLCYAINNMAGQSRGDYMGEVSVRGLYYVPYGWYLAGDKFGKPTAYKHGSGPMYHQPFYEAETKYTYDESGDEVRSVMEWDD